MSTVKQALHAPYSDFVGGETPIDIVALKSQVAHSLVAKAAEGDIDGRGAHLIFAGSPWRVRALRQALEVRAPVPRSPVRLLSPRRHRQM